MPASEARPAVVVVPTSQVKKVAVEPRGIEPRKGEETKVPASPKPAERKGTIRVVQSSGQDSGAPKKEGRRNDRKQRNDRRDKPRAKRELPPLNVKTAPVPKVDDGEEGISLSALAPRNEVKEEKESVRPTVTKNVNAEPAPVQTDVKRQGAAPEDKPDDGPKPVKPGEVVKF
jgi:hypothetical protein